MGIVASQDAASRGGRAGDDKLDPLEPAAAEREGLGTAVAAGIRTGELNIDRAAEPGVVQGVNSPPADDVADELCGCLEIERVVATSSEQVGGDLLDRVADDLEVIAAVASLKRLEALEGQRVGAIRIRGCASECPRAGHILPAERALADRPVQSRDVVKPVAQKRCGALEAVRVRACKADRKGIVQRTDIQRIKGWAALDRAAQARAGAEDEVIGPLPPVRLGIVVNVLTAIEPNAAPPRIPASGPVT